MTRGQLTSRPHPDHRDVGDCPGCGYPVWHNALTDCTHAVKADRIWWHTRCHKTSVNDRAEAARQAVAS